MSTKVKVWEEEVIIPTYGIGKSEKNPMFFEKRVYQGSSGAVYPYPVIESISDVCEDKYYHAVYLENEYIKVMILPELGGRVQMAYDKIKERHFIYYNSVIKPALVGLTGPWISGGIEFNWPQHHRPSTFLPIDFSIEECEDGSAIVWVSERERMFHQKGMAGFVLRPGCARLEIQGKLYNPTPVPQTFLWWANPAVAVNDFYQSVFPGDVNAVFDHGKRDVSKYPIATGTYYKMDYSAGVDISKYKNIPVPTSYMAIRSDYDFVGGYENDTNGGLLHVANHHISPGKKQWTWGNGDFGQAWDRNLTDSDGPYIELMTGIYTDNQPDFTWLQPYEEKVFTQYFMPYRELGVVKNATADILMNVVPDGKGGATLKLLATSVQKEVHVSIVANLNRLMDESIDLSPEEVFERNFEQVDANDISVIIYYDHYNKRLAWVKQSDEVMPIPEPAKPALKPQDVRSNEQLYLTGLHLEQYRHATYLPTDYYLEALRRDHTDARCNNAMGLWWIRKGKYAEAETYLRKAIATLTERNPNPYDGEAYYNLGVALKYQDNLLGAYDAFYKACWNAAWQDAGYFALAQISASLDNWKDALHEINLSLARNSVNHKARHLKVIILRQLGMYQEARELITESLQLDRFNFGCRFERLLLDENERVGQEMGLTDLSNLLYRDIDLFQNRTGRLDEETTRLMRDDARNYEELVYDYMQTGDLEAVLEVVRVAEMNLSTVTPMLYYCKASCHQYFGEYEQAIAAALQGEKQPDDEFFPNSLDALKVLRSMQMIDADLPKSLYLLGNIWYDKRQYKEAIEAWERANEINSNLPGVWRNLALAYFNKSEKKELAARCLERAFELDHSDARILMELDQLYKRMNESPDRRLKLLDKHLKVALSRDDLYLEYVTLLNLKGRCREAMEMLDAHKFHPWEGGEGKAPAQYQYARVELVKQCLKEKRYEEALSLIEECFVYPPHLGEGKLPGAQENDFYFYQGCALEGLGKQAEAHACFEKAVLGDCQPTAAMYYNDQKPDKIYYQGLAFLKLGREDKARSKFNSLIAYGEKHVFDKFTMDYFAVSLPDLQIWEENMDKKNVLHCNYLMALGHLGLGNKIEAERCFNEVKRLDQNFLFSIYDLD